MWYIIVFFLTLIVDQVTKIITDGNQSNITIIKNILSIKAIRNEGSAFSFLAGKPWAQTFFICLTIVVLIAGVIFMCVKTPKGKWLKTTITLMFSGTIGNFIDRIAFRSVRDFIEVSFFANFNVADICLCVGAIMLIVYILFLDNDAVFKKKDKSIEIEAESIALIGEKDENITAEKTSKEDVKEEQGQDL